MDWRPREQNEKCSRRELGSEDDYGYFGGRREYAIYPGLGGGDGGC